MINQLFGDLLYIDKPFEYHACWKLFVSTLDKWSNHECQSDHGSGQDSIQILLNQKLYEKRWTKSLCWPEPEKEISLSWKWLEDETRKNMYSTRQFPRSPTLSESYPINGKRFVRCHLMGTQKLEEVNTLTLRCWKEDQARRWNVNISTSFHLRLPENS